MKQSRLTSRNSIELKLAVYIGILLLDVGWSVDLGRHNDGTWVSMGWVSKGRGEGNEKDGRDDCYYCGSSRMTSMEKE